MKESKLSGNETERNPERCYEIYREVSGATEEDLNKLKDFSEKLPELPEDSFEAAKVVRHFLIKNGFEYDDEVFTLQDVGRKQKGNCLGVCLAVGSLLYQRGHSPQYELITNPRDAIYRQDLRLIEELRRGDHFDYDNPTLPTLADEAEHPIYRFAPLEHPVLILSGQQFETTSLEDLEEDPGWSPEAELKIPSSFEGVASHVYIDRIKTMLRKNRGTTDQFRELGEKALSLSPDNREAHSIMWEIARELGDKELEEESFKNFTRIGGEDSRYLYRLYEMTGDEKKLDLALEKYPANLLAYITKYVLLENDKKEARFNMAVAAWCAANSSVFRLQAFYDSHKEELEKLFEKGILKKVAA